MKIYVFEANGELIKSLIIPKNSHRSFPYYINKTGTIVLRVVGEMRHGNTMVNLTLIYGVISVKSPTADLNITKVANSTNPNYGDYISYTVTVVNNGPDNATGVIVNEKIPNGLVYVSDNSNGKYDPNTGIWNISNLANQEIATLVIVVRVNATGNITNNVNVTSNEYDNETEHNKDNKTIIVNASANLSINKSVNLTNVNYGDYISYTVTVVNNGPDNATGVIVNEKIPNGLVYVSDNSNGKYDPNTGIWNISNLANQEIATLVIVVRVNATGNITNNVNVTSNEYDNETEHNKDNKTIIVNASADLSIKKQVNVILIKVGDQVVYTITVVNNGPDNATNVTVNEFLPNGLIIISSNPSIGTFANNRWIIGDLANGQSATLILVVYAKTSGNFTNRVVVTANEYDYNTNNTEDSVTITVKEIPINPEPKTTNETKLEPKSVAMLTTGNPLLIILLLLATVFVSRIKSKK